MNTNVRETRGGLMHLVHSVCKWIITVFCLMIAYIASIGPAGCFVIGEKTVGAYVLIYWPVINLCEKAPWLGPIIDRWIDVFD